MRYASERTAYGYSKNTIFQERRKRSVIPDILPYLLLIFALDVSRSMLGDGARHLTEAMNSILSAAKASDTADHILVGLILFNDRIVKQIPPTPIQQFTMPAISPDGYTDLGLAVNEMMTMAKKWKDDFAADYDKKRFCPNLLLITDGEPCLDEKSDRDPVAEYRRIADSAREASVTTKEQSGLGSDQHHFHIVPIACGNANRELLKQLRPDHKIIDAGDTDGLREALAKLAGSIPQTARANADILTVAEAHEAQKVVCVTDPNDIKKELESLLDALND